MLEDSDKIIHYGPSVLEIECVRCKRRGQTPIHKAVSRYGADITVSEWVRRVAEEGGCKAVARGQCSAFAHKTEVVHWANLARAQDDHWRAILRCQRRHYALKRVGSCPPVELDVCSLVATHGRQCSLERLQRWARCPNCDSTGAKIQWVLPGEDVPDVATRRVASR